jgi:hypothetical protein
MIDSDVGPGATIQLHFPRVDHPSAEAFDTQAGD